MSKLDELITKHERLKNRETAAALRLLRDVAKAANGLSHGEDWNNGTHAIRHGYRNKLLTTLAALRDAGMLDAAPKPASERTT